MCLVVRLKLCFTGPWKKKWSALDWSMLKLLRNYLVILFIFLTSLKLSFFYFPNFLFSLYSLFSKWSALLMNTLSFPLKLANWRKRWRTVLYFLFFFKIYSKFLFLLVFNCLTEELKIFVLLILIRLRWNSCSCLEFNFFKKWTLSVIFKFSPHYV